MNATIRQARERGDRNRVTNLTTQTALWRAIASQHEDTQHKTSTADLARGLSMVEQKLGLEVLFSCMCHLTGRYATEALREGDFRQAAALCKPWLLNGEAKVWSPYVASFAQLVPLVVSEYDQTCFVWELKQVFFGNDAAEWLADVPSDDADDDYSSACRMCKEFLAVDHAVPEAAFGEIEKIPKRVMNAWHEITLCSAVGVAPENPTPGFLGSSYQGVFDVANDLSNKSHSMEVQTWVQHYKDNPILCARLEAYWDSAKNDDDVSTEYWAMEKTWTGLGQLNPSYFEQTDAKLKAWLEKDLREGFAEAVCDRIATVLKTLLQAEHKKMFDNDARKQVLSLIHTIYDHTWVAREFLDQQRKALVSESELHDQNVAKTGLVAKLASWDKSLVTVGDLLEALEKVQNVQSLSESDLAAMADFRMGLHSSMLAELKADPQLTEDEWSALISSCRRVAKQLNAVPGVKKFEQTKAMQSDAHTETLAGCCEASYKVRKCVRTFNSEIEEAGLQDGALPFEVARTLVMDAILTVKDHDSVSDKASALKPACYHTNNLKAHFMTFSTTLWELIAKHGKSAQLEHDQNLANAAHRLDRVGGGGSVHAHIWDDHCKGDESIEDETYVATLKSLKGRCHQGDIRDRQTVLIKEPYLYKPYLSRRR